MKRALILGTNAGQADIINYLNETGWETHACGHKRIGIGCSLAYKFHFADTIDVEAVKRVAQEVNADIVYSVSSDSAIRTATKVSEELGLPVLLSSEIVDLFHYKDRLRSFLNVNNINTVKFKKVKSINELSDWDLFPCVVKPSDSQGQRGVSLIEEKKDFIDAVENAIMNSGTKIAIIEEYLQGIEISTNVIIQNNKVIVNEFTERYIHGKKYFGLPEGHGIPVRSVSSDVIRKASSMVELMAKELKISDAVLYVQMVATNDGPKIIEVAPRLDGCHIWRMLKIAKGYDYREYAINTLLGKKIDHKSVDNGSFSLYFNQVPAGDKFHVNDFKEMGKDAIYQEYRYQEGDEIVPINGRLEVVGYYVKKDYL